MNARILLALLSAAPVLVEHVADKPKRGGSLGTGGYVATAAEEPFLKKVSAAEQVTGGMMNDYVLSKHDGAYVGWFGVVREVTEANGETKLVLEHKGFDGLTDLHILAIDFNGAGDFTVRIPGVGHKIERLTLLKVYGTAKAGKSGMELTAEYARNWHQGSFTFIMAAGQQHGSEKWRKLNTVALDDIYDPYPNDDFYVKRLGKR
jgi:hypothetical protein